jgi:uncharacterized membrane protein YeaQ/YmgE (transglycosylase-associated protein family)
VYWAKTIEQLDYNQLSTLEELPMFGILSWLGFGLIAGGFTAWQMAGRDSGLIAFTIGVGLAGALIGGFGAALVGIGGLATFSLFSLLFAALGSSFALLGYRKLIRA